jgi:hypothetical protein
LEFGHGGWLMQFCDRISVWKQAGSQPRPVRSWDWGLGIGAI